MQRTWLQLCALCLALAATFGCSGTEPNSTEAQLGSALGGSGPQAQATEEVPTDPCGEISERGICQDETGGAYCARPSDSNESRLVQFSCEPSERCDDAVKAHCVLREDACKTGATRCANRGELERCGDAATWEPMTCAGECEMTALGGACRVTEGVIQQVGRVTFDRRALDAELLSWSTPIETSASGLLIASFVDDVLLDVTTADAEGRYEVSVAESSETSRVQAWLLAAKPDGSSRYAVARPTQSEGEASIFELRDGQIWTFELPETERRISLAEGGAAVAAFVQMGLTVAAASALLDGQEGDSVVTWVAPSLNFSCTACFGTWPASFGDKSFDSQLWLSTAPGSEMVWAPSVVQHELGHWAMASFGRSPGEGGTHCLELPSQPGLAWSEGWASAFAAAILNTPIFYQEQNGRIFGGSLEDRFFSSGVDWRLPDPNAGPLQLMTESEVAALVLSLERELGLATLLSALSRPEVTEALGTGYLAHTWESDGCFRSNVEEGNLPAPVFNDFLNALSCGGSSQQVVETLATETGFPAEFFPCAEAG